MRSPHSWSSSATARSSSPSTRISRHPESRSISVSLKFRILSFRDQRCHRGRQSRRDRRQLEASAAAKPATGAGGGCRNGRNPKSAARALKIRHKTPPGIVLLLRWSPANPALRPDSLASFAALTLRHYVRNVALSLADRCGLLQAPRQRRYPEEERPVRPVSASPAH